MESAELIEILREVRDRVRARHPDNTAGSPAFPLPDLNALARARDSAMGKVAAIGSVNPRPPGLFNSLAQTWKRTIARILDWHVREQVVFNRRAMAAVDAAVEAFADTNRTLSAMGAMIGDIHARLAAVERLAAGHADEMQAFRNEFQAEFREFHARWPEMKDMRTHWAEWRQGWEHKLAQNEIQFLRAAADLQSAFSYRADLMDANYRDTARGQHADFMGALERSNNDVQKRLWADLEKVRLEYERLIHTELRLIRQRLARAEEGGAAAAGPAVSGLAGQEARPTLDLARFAERFRGPEERVKQAQRFYTEYFAGHGDVLDIGCGRGEFLELMREAGVPAVGIDTSSECVDLCRRKGLDARNEDLFAYLGALPEASLEGIFCAQVVEHIPPGRLPEMIRLCASRLRRGGVIAIETPNPECLAIFATYFYLDPTHQRPVPHQLLTFYLEESGVGVETVRKLAPAIEDRPALASLPEDFRDAFFDGLDYAVIGKKF